MTGPARAIGYATEAVRVLCRHPSLFLVALAMGAFSGVESQLGIYVTYGHTAWGRQMARQVRAMRANDGSRASATAEYATADHVASGARMSIVYPPPSPSVSLEGTVMTALALAYGRGDQSRDSTPANRGEPPALYLVLIPLLSFLIPAAIGLFVQGGYMGVVSRLLATGEIRWREFCHQGKRVFLRFLVLGGLLAGLSGIAGIGDFLSRHGWPGGLVLAYAVLPIMFFLNLAPFLIVARDAPLVGALRRSVAAIWRDLTAAPIQILGAGALAWLSTSVLLKTQVQGPEALWDPAMNALPSIPIHVLSSCAYSAVGLWFCVTAFLWCREVAGATTNAETAR